MHRDAAKVRPSACYVNFPGPCKVNNHLRCPIGNESSPRFSCLQCPTQHLFAFRASAADAQRKGPPGTENLNLEFFQENRLSPQVTRMVCSWRRLVPGLRGDDPQRTHHLHVRLSAPSCTASLGSVLLPANVVLLRQKSSNTSLQALVSPNGIKLV